MKSKRENPIFYVAAFLYIAHAVLSITLKGTVVPAAVSLPLLVLLFDIKKKNVYQKLLLILISYLLSIVLSALPALTYPSLVKAYALSYTILPLFALTCGSSKGKTFSFIFLIVTGVLSYITLTLTDNNYYYLNTVIADYNKYLQYSKVLFSITISVPFIYMIFNTGRNYLYFILLIAASILSSLTASLRGEAYPLLTPGAYYLVLILLIYTASIKEEVIVTERRKIVLSSLRVVDIEHLKKKEKPRIYEIPPNLPVDDREKKE